MEFFFLELKYFSKIFSFKIDLSLKNDNSGLKMKIQA